MLRGLLAAVRQVKTAAMDETPAPTLAERIAAAQAWWRGAGVDYAYAEDPQAWLAEPEGETDAAGPAVREAVAPPPPPPAIGGDRAGWPQDLPGFRRWWLEEPSLDHGGLAPRVPPRGEAGAPLMLVVPMPEDSDREALLSGPQGRLLASFALAAGLDPEAIYWAAVLPRHMAMPDWAGLAAEGFGDVLRHHLALAAPQRLIVLGRDVLPLLGHDPAQASPAVSKIAIQGRDVELLATYSPARLLDNARLRAELWRRWLDWTEGDEA
jgi:uracil-DNA glycosylase